MTATINKDDAIIHMKNGGQVYCITPKTIFYYKIKDGELLCRCNKMGG